MFFDEEEVECTHSCDCCSGCGHTHEDMELPEDFEPIITLTDEEGRDVKFEIVDVVALEENNKEYLIAAEVKDENSDDDVEVTILEINQDGDEEVYDVVTDEALADKVFKVFKSQLDSEEE